MSEFVNNGGIHNFKVEPIGHNRSKVYIDGKSVRCRGYSLEHFIDCVPSVMLEVCVYPQIEDNVKIEVGNKEEIARLMSKKEFDEFCDIWKRVREEKKSCINTACRHNKDKKCSSEDVGNVCPKRMTEEVVKNLSFF